MQLTDDAVVRANLMTRSQAAEYLGLAEQTLATWHSLGRYNIPVVKVGRNVRYRMTDLDRWIESRTVNAG